MRERGYRPHNAHPSPPQPLSVDCVIDQAPHLVPPGVRRGKPCIYYAGGGLKNSMTMKLMQAQLHRDHTAQTSWRCFAFFRRSVSRATLLNDRLRSVSIASYLTLSLIALVDLRSGCGIGWVDCQAQSPQPRTA